jgi:hypothetical protein
MMHSLVPRRYVLFYGLRGLCVGRVDQFDRFRKRLGTRLDDAGLQIFFLLGRTNVLPGQKLVGNFINFSQTIDKVKFFISS